MLRLFVTPIDSPHSREQKTSFFSGKFSKFKYLAFCFIFSCRNVLSVTGSSLIIARLGCPLHGTSKDFKYVDTVT